MGGRPVRFLSKISIDNFVLGIIAVAALATVLPARGIGVPVVEWVTYAAVAGLFFLYGARLSTREALDGLKHWRLHATVLAATYVLFPLIGLAMRIFTPGLLSDELYTGVLYLCLVPSTIQSSIVFTSIARGNVAGAVVSASASNLVGVLVTPLLVVLFLDTTGQVSIGLSAVVNVVGLLLVPFVLGQLARPLVGAWGARHAGPTRAVDRGSVLLVVYSAFSAGAREGIWSTMTVWQIVWLVLVCCLVLALVLAATAGMGRVLGFSRRDRVVIVFAGSKKSLASGLPMATVLFAGHPVGLIVLPLMIFHQIQLIACAVLVGRWGRASSSAT